LITYLSKIKTQIENNKPLIINYNDFSKNIIVLRDEIIKKEVIGVTIYIVSPVLVKIPKSKLRWKGIYMNSPIDFIIEDKKFLKQVENDDIKFGNGTNIKCVLEITTKTKYDGMEFQEEFSYLVKHVMQREDNENSVKNCSMFLHFPAL
jgi:hypothetical protein